MISASKLAIRNAARASRVGSFTPLTLSTVLYGGTDKGLHGYTRPYAEVMRRVRYRRIGVLEIGVGGYDDDRPSGSLRLWRDYFPRAHVVGLDIHPKSVDLGRRVRFVQGDQSDPDDLVRAVTALEGRPLTVVIDDGSHLDGHARASFETLFPLLEPGGLYAVEDLHTSYWPSFGGSIPAPDTTSVGLARELIDDVQFQDPTFTRRPNWGPRVDWTVSADVAELYVHPGLFIAVKRGGRR